MFCSACGHEVADGGRYCSECGAEVRPPQARSSITSAVVPYPPSSGDEVHDIGRRPFWLWFFGLAAASEIIAWVINPNGDPAVILGEGVGTTMACLIVALLIAGIRRIFTKHGFGLTVLQTWGIVFLLVTISNYYQRPTQAPDHEAEIQAAEQNLANAISQPSSTTSASATPTPGASMGQETNGQALARVINQSAEIYRQQRVAVQALLAKEQALPIASILTPESLTSAQGIATGRHVVIEFGHYIEGFQRITESYNDQVRSVIATAPVDLRAQVEQGFDESNAVKMAAVANYVAVERDIMTTVTQILDLAQRNLGASYAKDGQIYLPSDQLPQYQALIQKMQQQAAQEDAATKTMADIGKQSLDKIKRFESMTASTGSH